MSILVLGEEASLWTQFVPNPKTATNKSIEALAVSALEVLRRAKPRVDADALRREVFARSLHADHYLYRRLQRVADAYGLPPRSPARALVFLATEFEFNPYGEGFIGASRIGASTPKADLRSVGDLIANWAEPRLEHQLLALLAKELETSPEFVFPPFARLLDAVLTPHVRDGRRACVVIELAQICAAELRAIVVAEAPLSTIGIHLVEAGRRQGIVPPIEIERRVQLTLPESEGAVGLLLAELAIRVEMRRASPDELEPFLPYLTQLVADHDD